MKYSPLTFLNRISPVKAIWLLLTLLFTIPNVSGQGSSFPVQVIVQNIPPSPVNFAGYANENVINGPLRVQITLNDFTITDREVRLKVYFEGQGLRFESKPVVANVPSLFLNGGIPTVLNGAQLAPYFSFSNIQGLSATQYNNTIPDGSYQICFEVFDVLTNRKLSARSCTTTLVFKNGPPLLIAPANKSTVVQTNPQNIFFQWSPRQINVSNVEYELSLVEIWDSNVDPQTAFLSSPPVFQTTTRSTTFLYGPSAPLLLPNKRYAWRIQAKAKQGAEEIGLFKNDGYSEIYYFNHTAPCDLPTTVTEEIKGAHQVNINWEDYSNDIPTYTVRYRKKGTNDWFTSRTSTNWITIWDLKAATTYEYQLRKTCSISESAWSALKEITTTSEEDVSTVVNCGISPDINLDNKEPLPTLEKGDSFIAGDFNIKVLESSGTEGRFTGKGYVLVPYLESIKIGVEFTNILVNTDKQLAEGMVVTTYDESLSNIIDVDEVADTVGDIIETTGEIFEGDNDLRKITVDFEISKEDITVVNGKIRITDPKTGEVIEELATDDTVITDSGGNVYHVDSEGNVSEGGVMDEGGAVTSTNVEGVDNKGEITALTAPNIRITFNQKGTYGFDPLPESQKEKLAEHYEVIKDSKGKDYAIQHHAVKNGGNTTITAKIDQQNTDYDLKTIVFKTKQGEKLVTKVVDDKTIELTAKGHYNFEHETIYATVPSPTDKEKQLTAGAFTLWHLTDRQIKVELVTVNDATLPNGIFKDIAKIFEPGVATVSISSYTKDFAYDANNVGSNGLDIGDKPWLSTYNGEQKAVISAFKANSSYSKNTYYIFVFDDIKPSRPIAGFMPLQRQFGFVFTDKVGTSIEEGKGSLTKTIAHEIGHGVFALQHPFTELNTEEGATPWLMDYGNGVVLNHLNWAQIHNPDLKFYVFQDEGDGELAGEVWFTPDWEPVMIKKSSMIAYTSSSSKIKGTLPGFKVGGIRYTALFSSSGNFVGYFEGGKSDGLEYPIENIDKNKIDKVYLFVANPDGCNKAYESTYNYVTQNTSSIIYKETNFNIRDSGRIRCAECAEGKQFVQDYLKTASGQSEKDAIQAIAGLICSKDSEELILAYQKYYERWESKAKNFAAAYNLKFSWEKYYQALLKMEQWREDGISNLLESAIEKEKLRDRLFEIALQLDTEVIQLIPLDQKVWMLVNMLDDNLYNLFTSNHDEAVAKVVASVKDTEAKQFLDILISNDFKNSSDEPLLYVLKQNLSDFLNSKNPYTQFFTELNRLTNSSNSQKDVISLKTSITWNVKQKDYALVAFVVNKNDFKYQYNDNNHTVSITRCTEFEYSYDARLDKIIKSCKNEEYLLPEGSSPFDLVGVLILNDVSPLASDCREGIGRSELCGELLVVPAIFVDYLTENLNIQRWKNLGWNTFNVAVTIATLGEGALAIKAIQGAAAGTRISVTIQKSYQLLDFAYTASNIGLGLTQNGPYNCQNETDPILIQECNKRWEIWNDIGLALTVKGGLDLTKNVIEATVKLKNLTKQEINEFIEAIKLKKYDKAVKEDDLLKTVDELEKLIYINEDLKRQYEQLLAASNLDIPSFKSYFLIKLDGYPEDLSGFKKWINSLDNDNASLLQKLDALGDDVVKIAKDFDFSNPTSVIKFIEDPNLIDAWKVIKGNLILRRKLQNLENINLWLYKGINPQKLKDGIAKSRSKQNLINELGTAKSKLHAQVLIKDYDNIPGVVKGRYTSNGASLSDKVDLPNSWTKDVDLPMRQIENFTGKIEPLELKPGDKIFRVSSANGGSGAYWTRFKPKTLDDVVGGTAVQPQWNNFQYLYEYTVPNGITIKTWKGKTASQPVALKKDGLPVPSNYNLSGGDEQLFINYISKQDPNFKSILKTTKAEW